MQKGFVALAALLLAGCASLPNGKPDPRDPLERFNRSMFAFNDAMDKAVLKPTAKAYKKVLPQFARTGVSNFFNNLNTVGTAINDALQGKMRQAGHDSARFLMNSTLGLGGLFDPATSAGLELNDEDFGQTFGKWGMKPGPYLMLPFVGPSTFRDTVGKLVDQYTYPVYWLEDDSTRLIIRGVNLIDIRAGLLDLDEQINRSYDRYAFIRNAWLQRREFQVTDGAVDESEDLEKGMDEEPAPEQQPPDGAAPPSDAPPPQGNKDDAAGASGAPVSTPSGSPPEGGIPETPAPAPPPPQ